MRMLSNAGTDPVVLEMPEACDADGFRKAADESS